MNLPNTLTVSRIILSPIFCILFTIENNFTRLLSFAVFGIAALTDLFDGRIARRYNLMTSFGKFMDPLADKILTSSAFISFAALGYARAWMVFIIIAREFIISGLRSVAAYEGKVILPSFPARIKTAFQMAVIFIMLFIINGRIIFGGIVSDMPLFDLPAMQFYFDAMILATMILTLWTGVDYLLKNIPVLKDSLK